MPAGEPRLSAEAVSRDADLSLLESAARAAGAVTMSFFGRQPEIFIKANDSPVTAADLAANDLLAERLRAARPDYGWLSEESHDSGDRLTRTRSFVIDPIDGTREFIAGGPVWTISLAVVEAGRPIAAALYAPVRDEMFLAAAGAGTTLNGARLRVGNRTDLEGARLSGPRSLFRVLAEDGERLKLNVRYYASLAYRIALVASGRLDGAAAKGSSQDWDLAAADLLVHEAGGMVTSSDGEELRYDRADTGHLPIVAAGPGLHPALARLVREGLAAAAARSATGEGEGGSG